MKQAFSKVLQDVRYNLKNHHFPLTMPLGEQKAAKHAHPKLEIIGSHKKIFSKFKPNIFRILT